MKKISYVNAPKDIADSLKNAKQIIDFLPPPEELILKEPYKKFNKKNNYKEPEE